MLAHTVGKCLMCIIKAIIARQREPFVDQPCRIGGKQQDLPANASTASQISPATHWYKRASGDSEGGVEQGRIAPGSG